MALPTTLDASSMLTPSISRSTSHGNSLRVSEEVQKRKGYCHQRNHTEPCPAAEIERERSKIRAERAAHKERDHIKGIETASRRRCDGVNPRLICNMAGLHTQVDQNNARNQAWQKAAEG